MALTRTQMQQQTLQLEDDIAASLQRTTDRLEQTEELAYRTGAALAEQGAGIDRIQQSLVGLEGDMAVGERQISQLEVPWYKFWRRGSLFRKHRGLDRDKQQDDQAVGAAGDQLEERAPAASVARPGAARRPKSASSQMSTPEEEDNDPLDNIQRILLNIRKAAAEQQEEVAAQNAKLCVVETSVDNAVDRTARLNTRQKRQLRRKRWWF